MNYNYKISMERDESRWICIYYDNWEDDPNGFACLVKKIQEDCSGLILKEGLDRYVIIGAELALVYQYDSLFGMVVEYPADCEKKKAIEFINKYIGQNTEENICRNCGANVGNNTFCPNCGYSLSNSQTSSILPVSPTGRFKNKFYGVLIWILFIQIVLLIFSICQHAFSDVCFFALAFSFIPATIVSICCSVMGKKPYIRGGEKLGTTLAITNSIGLILSIVFVLLKVFNG